MVEEEKKPEEKKMEEKKPKEEKKEDKPKEEKPSEDNKEEKKTEEQTAPPPPPPEIVLRVYMHCEGCARKVRRCLKNFPGVEEVVTDCRTHKVVVKGEKADPLKVLARVQRKSHNQVELLSPIPKPTVEEDKKKPEDKEIPKTEDKDKKEEAPQAITVVLKVHMHCEACAQAIKKRIERMKGVENADPDLKSSQVTVKGAFDPAKLVDYIYKRTGRHMAIVKQEPEKKEEESKGKEVKDEKKGEAGEEPKKADGGGGGAAEAEGKENKEGAEAPPPPPPPEKPVAAAAAGEEEMKVVELKRNEFLYYYPQQMQVYPPPRYPMEYYHQYPPQIFSDENPNACSVM